MNFGIFLRPEAAKFLKNLDNEVKNRIIEKLKLLENGPFSLPYNLRFRLLWDYKITFRIFYTISTVCSFQLFQIL